MPGYGYAGENRDRERRRRNRSASSSGSSSRAPGKRAARDAKKDARREEKRRRKKRRAELALAGGGDPDKPGGPAASPMAVLGHAEADRQPRGLVGAWREEIIAAKSKESGDEGDDAIEDDEPLEGIVPEDDDEEAVTRKLAESRARREALIAKWVNRGEGPDGAVLTVPDTNTDMCDGIAGVNEESDDEVAKFFAEKRKELASSGPADQTALEEQKAVNRFILAQKAERDGDMFGDEDTEQDALKLSKDMSASIGQTGASGDDWNDAEGYYRAQIGELMDSRYLVVEDKCGQGVFSNVIKAKDQQDKGPVAIKIMRCNDMMRKAAEKEIAILEKLNKADKGNKKNVIRLMRYFVYRNHLCLVFECMWDNLRVALKKYTKDKGMSLRAVRAYTKQLLVALHHIHRCDIIHADIKPDNILISAGHNLVKICDLGSAMETREVEATPYIVSRFYRAPEIVLGAKYGPPADTFALAGTLFEIFTGKILFRGKTNNDMMRLFMEVKGKLPHKIIKTGMCWKQHFDENLDFKFFDQDKVTRKKVTRIITDCAAKPGKGVLDQVLVRVGPEKQKSEIKDDQIYTKKAKQFGDIMNLMTTLDPDRRATPVDMLQHPFVTEVWPAAASTKDTKDAKAQTPA